MLLVCRILLTSAKRASAKAKIPAQHRMLFRDGYETAICTMERHSTLLTWICYLILNKSGTKSISNGVVGSRTYHSDIARKMVRAIPYPETNIYLYHSVKVLQSVDCQNAMCHTVYDISISIFYNKA